MSTLFPALVYDTEGTDLFKYGQDNPADAEGQPRLLSIAAALVGADGLVLDEFDCLVSPGHESTPKAFEAHGITKEMCEASGVPITDALDRWVRLHHEAALTVAFNHAHDSKHMRGELRRLGRPDLYGAIPDFCCMWGSRKVCALPKGKIPSLAEACRILLGIEHSKVTGAHSAVGDRNVTVKLYLELVKRGLVEPKRRDASKDERP